MGWPYRQFQPCMRLPVSELGLLSEFARQWVVLVSATSICFCYYYCHRFSCHFQRHSTSSFGVVRPVSLGVTHCFAVMVANHAPVWLASFIDEFVLDILDKVCVAYLAFFIYRQLPKRMVHFFSGDKWWLIKHWFLERHGSSSSGTRWSIRLLSSCSSWTWRCWALPVWIYCFRPD